MRPSDCAGDDPERDSESWRTADGRTYEWFLLLKWLGHGPSDAKEFDREWVTQQLAADYVNQWPELPGETRWFFHGEYWYRVLAKPNLRELPSRPSAIAARLCWPVRHSAAGDLHDFIMQKDAVLADLLALIVAERGREPIAVAWFATAARWYPFLTALRPERAADAVAVLQARDGTSGELTGLVRELQTQCDDPTARDTVMSSFYWYQVKAMRADGTWQAPIAGWSTWTPQFAAAAPAAPRKLDTAAQAPDARVRPANSAAAQAGEPHTLGAERAWREICLRLARLVEKHPAVQRADRLDVAVHHAHGVWRFAFGTEELREVLSETPALKNKIAHDDGVANQLVSLSRAAT